MSFNSILDNDFYKFTMQYAVIKLYPDTIACYEFINRGAHEFPEGFADALREKLNHMSELKLTSEERKYLDETLPYLNSAYLDFLQGYRYDPSEVEIEQNGTELSVKFKVIGTEPFYGKSQSSWISELYYEMTQQQRGSDSEVVEIVKRKAQSYLELGVKVAEFGTRRRHSYEVHTIVADALKNMVEILM